MALNIIDAGDAIGPESPTATWEGPFDPGSVMLVGVGLFSVADGAGITVTSDQGAGLLASDPEWWSIGFRFAEVVDGGNAETMSFARVIDGGVA